MGARELFKFCDDFVEAVIHKPVDYPPIEDAAWKIASELQPFDWMKWTDGFEAIQMPELILQFSREDALKLLQMITRQQRFSEGDFSIDGKYFSTEHSHFAEMFERGVLSNIATVIDNTRPYQVTKCDLCLNGHVEGIKTMIFPGLTVNFCLPCGKKKIMQNRETGEEKTLFELWEEASQAN